MDIKFTNIREEYIIPLSLVMYLNETYEDKDVSFKILHYFLCYLSEVKQNRLLESYKNDANEIKITLNKLSNKNIKFNQKYNDYIVDTFCTFIQEKKENLIIVAENVDNIEDNVKFLHEYEQFCQKVLKEKEGEELVELVIIDDSTDEEKNTKEDEEGIEFIDDNEDNKLSIKKIFNKYFDTPDKLEEKKYIPISPDYEWNQTSLRFKKPDGTWGKWVDLKGTSGKSGGGSKGLNREQVNELIQDALALEESSTVSNVFPFFMS